MTPDGECLFFCLHTVRLRLSPETLWKCVIDFWELYRVVLSIFILIALAASGHSNQLFRIVGKSSGGNHV